MGEGYIGITEITQLKWHSTSKANQFQLQNNPMMLA